MIPISKPSIGKHEVSSVVKILRSGHLAQGPIVSLLEKQFAKVCKTRYAVAVNSGTAALHTALIAAGIKPGDEVITTPFTFVATANSILMAGAQPIFVDIDPMTYNIDPQLIERAITRKTKAILVVNLYGQPADYEHIGRIAKRNNLIIVEDAAQSIGAQYKNNMSGNLGDIGCFSFYATKNIMSGEGGMITTNSKEFDQTARRFRNHGQDEGVRYVYKSLGYNYRMTDIIAAIALEQLKNLKTFTKRRQGIAKKYTDALRHIEGIVVPSLQSNASHAYHQYTIRVTKEFPLHRDQLKEYLYKNGVGANIYYPLPLYKFDHLKNGKRTMCPVTERASIECLSLPIYPLLKDIEINKIITLLKKASS